MVSARGGHADVSQALGPILLLRHTQSPLKGLPARVGDKQLVQELHVLCLCRVVDDRDPCPCWGGSVHSSPCWTRRGGCECHGPQAGSGRLPWEVFVSAGDLCSCCWLFWRVKSCDCFRLGFFGFFLKSSALSHCKYQQSCSLYSKE